MSELHALLIGIDGYLPNEPFGPAKDSYEQLEGCVADVREMAAYLSGELGVRKIDLLTASRHADGELPIEPREEWPTYETMVAAFHRIAREAKPGDQVYVHFVGHGGVVDTAMPEVKGLRGIDETLVPVDIGQPGARPLRDIELNLLFHRLVDRGLYVTLVLDCCHSGGALRSGGFLRGPNGEMPRGVPTPYPVSHPFESLAGTRQEIRALLGPDRKPDQRDAAPAHLLRAQDAWVTLTACQANQQAYTVLGEDGIRHGILSYEWLAMLKAVPPGSTYQAVYEHIAPRIRERRSSQNPLLYGEGDRVVFGKDRIPRRSTVAVSAVEGGGRELKLNTGQIQGVVTGSRFGIYPQGCEQIDAIHRRAVVEVIKPGTTDSRAKVVGALPDPSLVPGMQATLEHPGAVCLQSSVLVVEEGSGWRSVQKEAGDALRARLLEGKSSFVRLAAGSDAADLRVIVNGEGAWEVRDPWGQPLAFPSVPPVPLDSPELLMRRLEQLTKFRNVDRLVNPAAEAPELAVEWVEPPSSDPCVLQEGETRKLRIANRSCRDLHVVALVLRGDGSIQRSPLGSERAQLLLLRGGEVGIEGEARALEVTGQLATGQTSAIERIKVFAAAKGTTQFGWLELPPWDGKPRPRPALRHDDPLEVILASLAGEWPAMREVLISGRHARDWAVATLDLRVES